MSIDHSRPVRVRLPTPLGARGSRLNREPSIRFANASLLTHDPSADGRQRALAVGVLLASVPKSL
jgi:hypothetical protein